MDVIFKKIETTFKSQEATRDRLRERREEADVKLRSAQRAIHQIHVADDLAAAARAALEELKDTGVLVLAIEETLPEEAGAYDRYVDLWYFQIQMGVMVAVLIGFVLEDTLVGVDRVAEMMGAKVRIKVEDYLVGICQAIQELARLSMNRVIKGDYDTPRRCAKFANDVSNGMKQLNLRNDNVRKRYDGIKYDVKKLEEIVYDLSIRGLVKDDVAKPKAEKDISTDKEMTTPGDGQPNNKQA